MAAFMARHAYCGRRTAAEFVQRLRSAPPSVAGELEAEAKGECVRPLVAVLRPLVAQLATLSAAIEHAVDAYPDGKIVTPLFRSGRICAAQPHLADTTRHTNRWARSIYQRGTRSRARAPHAIGILTRASCRVIWTCWQQRTPYDPTKHRPARAFTVRLVDQEAA